MSVGFFKTEEEQERLRVKRIKEKQSFYEGHEVACKILESVEFFRLAIIKEWSGEAWTSRAFRGGYKVRFFFIITMSFLFPFPQECGIFQRLYACGFTTKYSQKQQQLLNNF